MGANLKFLDFRAASAIGGEAYSHETGPLERSWHYRSDERRLRRAGQRGDEEHALRRRSGVDDPVGAGHGVGDTECAVVGQRGGEGRFAGAGDRGAGELAALLTTIAQRPLPETPTAEGDWRSCAVWIKEVDGAVVEARTRVSELATASAKSRSSWPGRKLSPPADLTLAMMVERPFSGTR